MRGSRACPLPCAPPADRAQGQRPIRSERRSAVPRDSSGQKKCRRLSIEPWFTHPSRVPAEEMAALTCDLEECAGNSAMWPQRRSTRVNRPLAGVGGPTLRSALLEWISCPARRDGRVVDGGGLENRWTGNGPGGSNPSPSANLRQRSLRSRLRLAGRVRWAFAKVVRRSGRWTRRRTGFPPYPAVMRCESPNSCHKYPAFRAS